MSEQTEVALDALARPAIRAGVGLDQSFAVTFFRDKLAASRHEERLSLRSLSGRVGAANASAKGQLPWLKLARFGDLRTDKGSLRHDANVLAITGIEADYDGGEIPFEDAVERLSKAGVRAMVYTSPGHTEDAPRWRVLCPASAELPPHERRKLLGRLNGLFRGVLSAESWTLSQGYYFGSVNSNPSHRVTLIDGAPIDMLHDLDETWCGKPHAAPAIDAPCVSPRSGAMDEAVLLADIVSGRSYHSAHVRLLGKWARDGVPYMEARARLIAAMDAVPRAGRDARWQARRDDVDRCVEGIYVKEAKARDDGHRPAPCAASARPASDDEPWPEPVDFLGDDELTGVPELRPEHLPDALYPFVVDTAARMGSIA